MPYYERLVQSGQAPRDINSWDDFRDIPELNRAILQEHASEFIRRSGPPNGWLMTAGSTGTPIRFGIWHDEANIHRILKLVLWQRVGYQLDGRLFLIWGHAHLLGTGWRGKVRDAKRRVKDAVVGYRRVNAYVLNPERCAAYGEQLIAHRPTGVVGYAAALDYFVRTAAAGDSRYGSLGVKFVMPCAEPPPHPDTFDLLRTTFRCPVIQEFGGVDFGQVGMQFDGEPFKVFHAQNILEAPPAEGSCGAAVVTSLYRRYLPLIRYRQGDLISGHNVLPHGHVTDFTALVGRENDMLELPSGQQVHSVAVFHCIHQEPSVLNIQMVLEDDGVSVRLVTKTAALERDAESRIRGRLSQLSPDLATAQILCVTDVETNRAGKRRWFVDKRRRMSTSEVRQASSA